MHSDAIKSGPARAPARAMLRATGLDDAAIAKPFVGVIHTWSDVSPCNLTLRDLAQDVRRGDGGRSGRAMDVALRHACRETRSFAQCQPRGS